jgi:hypothetical protein
VNQGWKDSGDGIVREDGSFPQARDSHRTWPGDTTRQVDRAPSPDPRAFHDRADRNLVCLRPAGVAFRIQHSACSWMVDARRRGSRDDGHPRNWHQVAAPIADRGGRGTVVSASPYGLGSEFGLLVALGIWRGELWQAGAAVTWWYVAAMLGVILVMVAQGYLGGELVYRYGAEVKFRYRELPGRRQRFARNLDIGEAEPRRLADEAPRPRA